MRARYKFSSEKYYWNLISYTKSSLRILFTDSGILLGKFMFIKIYVTYILFDESYIKNTAVAITFFF